MAIGLKDLNTKKQLNNNIDNTDLLKSESNKSQKSIADLSSELKDELESFEKQNKEPIVSEKKFSDIKRPWESFSVNEMASSLKAEKAVKKAQIIKQRNERLAKELRERSDLLMRDPELFFNN